MWPDNYSRRLWETSKKKMNFAFDDDVVLLQSGLSEPGGPGGHCVLKWGFMWTFPGNQDATLKLKSELIFIKF